MFKSLYLAMVGLMILEVELQNLFEETVKLHETLFNNHSIQVRPVTKSTKVLVVDVALNIEDATLNGQELTSDFILKMSWTDQLLQWNTEHYFNISMLHLEQKNLWLPRLQVHNSVGGGSFKCFEDNIKLHYDGKVEYMCRSSTKVRCSTAFVRFPFDGHNCSIPLIISNYDQDEVQFGMTTISKSTDVTASEDQNKDWVVQKVNIRTTKFNWSDSAALDISLQLTRDYLFGLEFILIPVVLVSMLNLLTFLIPANGLKVMYTLLIFLLMMLLVYQMLPFLPKTCNCALNLYISCLLILNFLTVSVSVGMFKCYFKEAEPIPVSVHRETRHNSEDSKLPEFLYDFKNPHNFLFYEKMLQRMSEPSCFSCCPSKIDDDVLSEFNAYMKHYGKTKKNKYSSCKMFVFFTILWILITVLYFIQTLEII